MLYPKGSEWRKWDLHVHSPESAFSNRFSGKAQNEKWENYINCLEKLEDISVVGVTDYFSIDGYIQAKRFKDSGRLKNIDLLLPNVELRLDHNTQDGVAINIHIIFDPEVIDMVNGVFFTNLKFTYKENEYSCTQTDLIRLGRAYNGNEMLEENVAFKEGANQFKVSVDHLKDVLKKNSCFHGKHLIVIPNSNRDGNSGLREGNLKALREELYRLAHCIFSSNPKDRAYFLGLGVDSVDDIIMKYNALKPCIHGSDAHSLETVCKPDNDRFTWIKADPSFEGLKQIIFEPEDRVQIQKNSPATEYPKAHFSSIKASGSIFKDEELCFKDCSVPLNNNLVTLIGGRGTGKSLLLDVMHRTFYEPTQAEISSNDRLVRIGKPEFGIVLTKSDGESTNFKRENETPVFDYLHVRQGEVKEVVENKRDLGEAIKRMLGFLDSDTRSSLNDSILSANRDSANLQEWLEKKDTEGNNINSEGYQKNQKIKLQKLKDTITTENTKEKISSFSSNSSLISRLKKAQMESISLRDDIGTTQDRLNLQINSLIQKDIMIGVNVDKIDLSIIQDQLTAYAEEASAKIANLERENTRISEDLYKKGIKGDISGLLDKVKEYQQEIERCNSAIDDILDAKNKLDGLFKRRVALVEQIVISIDDELESFERKFADISKGRSGVTEEHKVILRDLLKNIEIKGEILFDKDKFIDGLYDFFNGRKIRKDALKEVFPINDADDYFALVLNAPVIAAQEDQMDCLTDFILETEWFLRKDMFSFLNYLYSEENRNEYLQVVPSIKYFGKYPEQLSVGQRGTFYVCLKLATSAFLTPFIFDQPEDDLDNAFIVEELEPIFRKIKKHRQVIIVTHNANLVVNADAEQIIIAENENEEISYRSGSLECPEIRKEVCRILEGGEHAFKKREKRYELH